MVLAPKKKNIWLHEENCSLLIKPAHYPQQNYKGGLPGLSTSFYLKEGRVVISMSCRREYLKLAKSCQKWCSCMPYLIVQNLPREVLCAQQQMYALSMVFTLLIAVTGETRRRLQLKRFSLQVVWFFQCSGLYIYLYIYRFFFFFLLPTFI